jgi:predicted  nucleic acid-binding Zn-ribbon protein
MTEQSYAHETVAWAKQRLDDLDTIISEVEKSADSLKDSARKETDRALAQLQESRIKLQKYYDDLRTEADAAKRGAEDIEKALEAEWVEVESAFQSFLLAVRDQADTVRGVLVARAEAQRQSWETSLKDLRDQAAAVVDKARGEFDGAIKRLSDEAEKFQSRIGVAKDAGDESWKAVKSGLADAKAVHDRTIQKIKEALSKLL